MSSITRILGISIAVVLASTLFGCKSRPTQRWKWVTTNGKQNIYVFVEQLPDISSFKKGMSAFEVYKVMRKPLVLDAMRLAEKCETMELNDFCNLSAPQIVVKYEPPPFDYEPPSSVKLSKRLCSTSWHLCLGDQPESSALILQVVFHRPKAEKYPTEVKPEKVCERNSGWTVLKVASIVSTMEECNKKYGFKPPDIKFNGEQNSPAPSGKD